MQILAFALFLFASHLGAMQVFRFTTYHAYFWKALPFLVAYGAAVGWALFNFQLHAFFTWQLLCASVWLWFVGRKSTKQGESMLELSVAENDAEYTHQLSVSFAKTRSYFAYSSFAYVIAFSVSYLWLLNS